MRRRRPTAAEIDAFVRRVEAARDGIAPRLPDIDPGDLLLILQHMLRPSHWERRFFVRRLRPGVYAP